MPQQSKCVVTQDDVTKVAHLARLRLEGEDLVRLARQLDEILAYVTQLQSVSTRGVEPTSHVLPLSNVMRPDQITPCLTPEQVLSRAPARSGALVKVPKVIET